MIGAEIDHALSVLKVTPDELAFELEVSPRSVHRWRLHGIDGPPEAALRCFLRLKAIGLAWRKNERAIGLDETGKAVFLPDHVAVARHYELKIVK